MYQTTLAPVNNLSQLALRLSTIGNVIIYLLIALGFIYIIWNIVQYFIKGKEGDESRHEAGMHIFWGIVGLAIIFSIWGLVNILIQTFGTSTTNLPNIPSADFVNSNNIQQGGVNGQSRTGGGLFSGGVNVGVTVGN